MTTQTNNAKLTAFAQAVGADIKRLDGRIDNLPTLTKVQEKLTALETKIKADLFGGDVAEAYDTFKEIADKLAEIDGSIGAAITEKLNELKTELKSIKDGLDTDLVTVYNEAKA